MIGLGNLPGDDVIEHRLCHVGRWIDRGGYIRDRGCAAAFIWDQAHGMRNLRTVPASDYRVDLTGWQLVTATDISADGLTIAARQKPGRQIEASVVTDSRTVVGTAGGFLDRTGDALWS